MAEWEWKRKNSIFTTNYQLNGDIAADLLHSNGNVGQTGIGVCLEVLKSVKAAINEEGNRMDAYLKQTNGWGITVHKFLANLLFLQFGGSSRNIVFVLMTRTFIITSGRYDANNVDLPCLTGGTILLFSLGWPCHCFVFLRMKQRMFFCHLGHSISSSTVVHPENLHAFKTVLPTTATDQKGKRRVS